MCTTKRFIRLADIAWAGESNGVYMSWYLLRPQGLGSPHLMLKAGRFLESYWSLVHTRRLKKPGSHFSERGWGDNEIDTLPCLR